MKKKYHCVEKNDKEIFPWPQPLLQKYSRALAVMNSQLQVYVEFELRHICLLSKNSTLRSK
uniref:Polycomb group protein EMBRYONIC FLOWER 2-like isoform X7 n=1 Tax=Rhizophora mucronata TaxID=61149 RepID=A0A2P2MKC7_RHIMU